MRSPRSLTRPALASVLVGLATLLIAASASAAGTGTTTITFSEPEKGSTFTYVDVEGTATSTAATVMISVNSKTQVVTNVTDSGPGSLRQALNIAATSNSNGASCSSGNCQPVTLAPFLVWRVHPPDLAFGL